MNLGGLLLNIYASCMYLSVSVSFQVSVFLLAHDERISTDELRARVVSVTKSESGISRRTRSTHAICCIPRSCSSSTAIGSCNSEGCSRSHVLIAFYDLCRRHFLLANQRERGPRRVICGAALCFSVRRALEKIKNANLETD